MIVRTVEDTLGTDAEVRTPNWVSKRLLLKRDGMGYSVHETTIFAGTETYIWYKNHLEAVFCVEGEGEVELIPSGEKYRIVPGTIYALDKHDKHYLRAFKDLRLVCVFAPALTGREVHDEEGVYPLIEEEEQASAESPAGS